MFQRLTARPATWIAALSIAVAVCAAVADEDPAPDAAWLKYYDKAVEQSKATGRPIMAYFTGSDWCEWCAKFDKQVLAKKAFRQWADQRVVLLKLDFPKSAAQSADIKKQNMKLKEKYHVKGFPAVLFLDAEGKVLTKTGYKPGGAEAWIEHADGLLKRSADKS